MKNLQDFMKPYYERIKIKNIEKLKNKTILITGASGLIGSNLTAYLNFLITNKKLNIKIIAVTRSAPPSWLAKSKKITYIKTNLSKSFLKKNIRFDYLIHCATYGQPKKFLEHPLETINLNIGTLSSLLDLSIKNKARVIYLSSAEIYGEADKQHIPTEESFFGYVNTLSDRAIYAESKRLAETICYIYQKNLSVKIARLLICYGPGVKMDDSRVYSEFIKKAQNTGLIVMMDQGLAQRTFCFVSDAIEMLLNVLLNGRENVYNIAGKETTTIRKLADMIAKINKAKVSSEIQLVEIKGTPMKSTLSNKRYLSEFQKKQFVSLMEGMTATSSWFTNLKSK